MPVTDDLAATEKVRIERTPALVEAEERPDGTTLYVPTAQEGGQGGGLSHPALVTRLEAIRPVFRRGLAGMSRPDRTDRVRLTPRIVREIVKVARARETEGTPELYLTRTREGFSLSGTPMSLSAKASEVGSDVAAWLAFFGNYEEGFTGDVPRLQRDYFTFMCWFYFAPLMCDLRTAALRRNVFSFDQPMFAVLYGSSNCGKTSLIETLMTSMFEHPRIVEAKDFTAARLRGLQQAYRRFPVVFDDVTRDRFSRHADEVIKDETVGHEEYPCFALSMNADARSFKPEIVKRCLMIYTRTSLPGNSTSTRRRLRRSVASIRERMTTSLYRHYLARILPELDAAHSRVADGEEGVDALLLSSTALCRVFAEHVPPDTELPHWCRPMTLEEYQERAFERPRRVLDSLLAEERYSAERRPPEQCWTVSGDRITVSVASMGFTRTKADVPDWLLDDTASTSGQIVLNRKDTEDFLKRAVRPPSRWRRWPWLR